MMGNAISIALMVTSGFVLLYQKLPRNIRKWIVAHSLVTDFGCMVITYWMFGGTVTALMAGAIVDLMVSAILHIANHPQDFEWLFDAFKQIRVLMDRAQQYIKELNVKYKEARGDNATLSSSVGGAETSFA
jgi:hypothetical protein